MNDSPLDQATRQAGNPPIGHATVTVTELVPACRDLREAGARLVSLWGSDERDVAGGFALHVALASASGLTCLEVPLAADDPVYPDLAGLFANAARLQRATRDLFGIVAAEGDPRPWLRHANWPADYFPLRKDADASRLYPLAAEDYGFVPVEGTGVHEIPVGPIHAGIIEPGHFRFSVSGEKVLRLEQRLGWKHKGIDKRFESLTPQQGAQLAARVSGDSCVAFGWAYCQAHETLGGTTPSRRAVWLRALMLERERVANHLGDLGYLGNDAALAFALAQFMRLKEDWLRVSALAFGHRYMMDRIVPGGVAADLADEARREMLAQATAFEREIRRIRRIFEEHAVLQDRFVGTGTLAPELAHTLGVTGLAGRASGQPQDLRCDFPLPPYDELAVRRVVRDAGDVAARVELRFEELLESLRLVRRIVGDLPDGAYRTDVTAPAPGSAVGWVEGWRGEVLVALTVGQDGRTRRCHCHDPSWHNWPALEHAIIGNIVPDFPLINKSFNLSYAGADL